jgi:hypothetical protein
MHGPVDPSLHANVEASVQHRGPQFAPGLETVPDGEDAEA